MSTEHLRGSRYLVFGHYWAYADGDQLLYDVDSQSAKVIAYLHEHGPLYESYAPSLSLALWRMIDEIEDCDAEEA